MQQGEPCLVTALTLECSDGHELMSRQNEVVDCTGAVSMVKSTAPKSALPGRIVSVIGLCADYILVGRVLPVRQYGGVCLRRVVCVFAGLCRPRLIQFCTRCTAKCVCTYLLVFCVIGCVRHPACSLRPALTGSAAPSFFSEHTYVSLSRTYLSPCGTIGSSSLRSGAPCCVLLILSAALLNRAAVNDLLEKYLGRGDTSRLSVINHRRFVRQNTQIDEHPLLN